MITGSRTTLSPLGKTEEIEKLKDEKLDKVIVGKLSTDVLDRLDVSGETPAVQTLKSEVIKIINVLKSK